MFCIYVLYICKLVEILDLQLIDNYLKMKQNLTYRIIKIILFGIFCIFLSSCGYVYRALYATSEKSIERKNKKIEKGNKEFNEQGWIKYSFKGKKEELYNKLLKMNNSNLVKLDSEEESYAKIFCKYILKDTTALISYINLRNNSVCACIITDSIIFIPYIIYETKEIIGKPKEFDYKMANKEYEKTLAPVDSFPEFAKSHTIIIYDEADSIYKTYVDTSKRYNDFLKFHPKYEIKTKNIEDIDTSLYEINHTYQYTISNNNQTFVYRRKHFDNNYLSSYHNYNRQRYYTLKERHKLKKKIIKHFNKILN